MAWVLLPIGLGIPLAALLVLWLIGERGHLILPSTRAALRGSGARKLDLDAVHAYIYGRWTTQYISFVVHTLLPRMSPETKQHWADRYHGKVLTPELAQAIITLDHDIERCNLEQIIPYPMARDIVLEGPPDVTVYECGCRHARKNPCQPTQVCMIIGSGDFVLDHHPNGSRRITQAEALDLLRAEHERGHVHTAYFKDVCQNRFYAICNCCSCCCGGLEAMMRYGVPMVASSGYVAQVDEIKCAGCGTCEESCPFEAIAVGRDYIAQVDWEKCMGCGVCTGQCPNEAVSIVLDERKGVPLDVRAL